MTSSTQHAVRNTPVIVTAVLVVLGVALFVVGAIYFKDTAGALPSVFPGHLAGSAHKHTKHGIVAVALGVVSLLAAWLSSGRRRT